jgi:hypothetical protein
MISANEGNPDTFRMEIWVDNGSQQSLGGGSIVVHAKKDRRWKFGN